MMTVNDTKPNRDELLEQIASRLGVRAERGRRFAELTSLRVGGAIDWVVSPETEDQAAAIVHEMDQAGIAWRALGSGSNVLADDGDHHYVVLSLKELKGELGFELYESSTTLKPAAKSKTSPRIVGGVAVASASAMSPAAISKQKATDAAANAFIKLCRPLIGSRAEASPRGVINRKLIAPR